MPRPSCSTWIGLLLFSTPAYSMPVRYWISALLWCGPLLRIRRRDSSGTGNAFPDAHRSGRLLPSSILPTTNMTLALPTIQLLVGCSLNLKRFEQPKLCSGLSYKGLDSINILYEAEFVVSWIPVSLGVCTLRALLCVVLPFWLAYSLPKGQMFYIQKLVVNLNGSGQ